MSEASLARPPQASEAPARRGVTFRSVCLAVIVSICISLLVNYVEYVVHASRMTLSHFPMGAMMVYLLLVLVLNPAGRLLARRYALSSTELMVVLAGALVGGAIPSVGLTGYMLGVIAAPFYFATPENQWAEYFHPHIPQWLAPRNVNGTLNYLYQGLPPGRSIPWDAWYVPIACWMAFVTALFVASICLATILRKQWVENERLVYPILKPVLDLTDQAQKGWFPRRFWVGFSIAFGILAWNMIGYFLPGFPQVPNIQWGPWIRFQRYFPGYWTRINMYTISFAYFANIDVLFSLWFFDFLFVVRSGILNRLGYNASSWAGASPEFAWIPLGALFALVFWSLWTARGHLKAVFRHAMGRGGLDASEEMMDYRTAVFGFVLSVIFAVCWLWRAGMGFGVAALFVFSALVLYLGVARIVSDVGLVFVAYPVGPQRFVTYTVGAENLSGSSLTALAFTNAISSFGKGLFMPAVTHGAKIADTCPKEGRRSVLSAMFLAFAVGAAASIAFTLYLGYRNGAYNFNDFPFTRYSKSGFDAALAQMRSPDLNSLPRLELFGVGVVGMSILTFLKYRFPWWPLHPIGFALGGTGTYVRYTVFSVFLAWAIKYVILRIGGASLYRRYSPFFLGVLVGYTTGVAVSLVVDVIWFPGAGHSIHGY